MATLRRWSRIPARIRRAVAGRSRRELAARGGSQDWSAGEYVHHLVEANVVAASIIVAALGKPGCTYDWSWLFPDRAWMARLGYRRLRVGPALDLLAALSAHVSALVAGARGGPASPVRLRGSARRPTRTTVEKILREECEHADHHLRDIREILGSRSGA
ncbi:MAG TPA: hypothetical protein VFL12_13535 [Thermoanaerobaculia bacterium]|nr:hypothetical protein [Thermoanaerobaculia bacterium]